MKINPPIMNIDFLQQKLADKLIGKGWDKALRFFTKSTDFYDILLWLHTEKIEGRRWSPALNDVFKPFELCVLDDLKVVFVNKEPHQDPTLHNGLAISHKGAITSQIPFRAFYDALTETVPQHKLESADLSSWAKQGVLLLNTNMTAKVEQPNNKHYRIWQPFVGYLWDILNRREDLIWIFIGENPYEELMAESRMKIKVAELPTRRMEKWDCKDLFNRCNELLKNQDKKIIEW